MWNDSVGGDDTLTATGDGNLLFGDAFHMTGDNVGGDDPLISGTGDDRLYGDAYYLLGASVGGEDTFVFLLDSGRDAIGDFDDGRDLIDVSGYGITGIEGLYIDGQTIYFGADDAAADSVTLYGFAGTLDADDFIFA